MVRGLIQKTKLDTKSGAYQLSVLVVLVITCSLLFPIFASHLAPPPAPTEISQPGFSSYNVSRPVSFSVSPPAIADQQRPLFPYSIIPRGVGSIAELKTALAHDPVAAAQYAGFNLTQARKVRAKKERVVYVSYRVGNHVFWTKRKVTLSKGEALITDGRHTARARCGNRISEVPVGPVSPEEPPAATLNTPSLPAQSNVPLDPYDPAPLWVENLLPAPLSLSPGMIAPPSVPGGGIILPPIFPIGCCGGSHNPTPSPPPTPPVSTPEPGTLLLLTAGAASLFLLRKRLPQ